MTHKSINATVSGSFRRAMGAVQEAVYALTDAGAHVLSPADPRVVDTFGDFVFVASDRVRAIKLVQSRHLAAIAASDLVWLVAPEGYIGQSGAMEIGYAVSVGTPVFTSEVPTDLTLRQYVTTLSTPEDAIREVRLGRPKERDSGIAANVLLDPEGVLQMAHDDLDRIAVALSRPKGSSGPPVSVGAERLITCVAQPLRSR